MTPVRRSRTTLATLALTTMLGAAAWFAACETSNPSAEKSEAPPTYGKQAPSQYAQQHPSQADQLLNMPPPVPPTSGGLATNQNSRNGFIDNDPSGNERIRNMDLGVPGPASEPPASAAPGGKAGDPGGGGGGLGKDEAKLRKDAPSVPAPGRAAPPAPKARPADPIASQPAVGEGRGFAERAPEAEAGRQRAEVRRDDVRPLRLPDIPGSRPSLEEEIWVIRRADRPAVDPARDDLPGSGSMVCSQPQPDGQTRPVPIPLKHTAVHAAVSGHVAAVEVVQQYHNPFSSKIEAVYVFPLPENAAVSDFVMTIGTRRIRGVIRDRAEAEQIYADARAAGRVASLMTQERPNIFTQKVANIDPGAAIDVAITYYNTLAYNDGWFEFVLPMVVGPRYNPPGFYDGVGAAPNRAAGASGQPVEVQYLRPGERSGHDISVALTIDGAVPLAAIESRSHAVSVQRDAANPRRAAVTLSPLDRIPNRDLVVRWQVAGDSVRSGGQWVADASGDRFFNLLLVPPRDVASIPRKPVEMVFVLDCSGSMSGRPIEQAVAAAERGLRRLQPGDTFQVINFAQSASQLGPAPLAASPANIDRAVAYLRSLFAQGGTEMINGIRASLEFPHDPQRLRYVVFLTDGFIGNEQDILAAIHARLGGARIFSFGVGSSTNRYLLDAMARAGRGCVAHVAAGDNPVEIIDRFFDRVSRPAITDLSVSVLGAADAEIFPAAPPDLYVGRVVSLSGRIPAAQAADGPVRVMVRGSVNGRPYQSVVELAQAPSARPGGAPAPLPRIWARHKIADLVDHAPAARAAAVAEELRSVALRFGLLSVSTSFIAVDSLTQTMGAQGTTVPVPVPVPDGVRSDTTVPEPAPARPGL
ncbi:MAG: VWA domain-containing protein [Phycisphaerae bacterium]|nr:VWA domain-containing protein [Phycisphaerae bacterium]